MATGCVESTVNQVISKRVCKKQQRHWSKRGAPRLILPRVKTLHQARGAVCQRAYRALQLEEAPWAA